MDIKDYLVLRQGDAIDGIINNTKNNLVWNIPPSYYSNQRSNTCSVKLIDAYGTNSNFSDQELSVLVNLTVSNQYNTANSSPYLGKLLNGKQNSGYAMSLLTSARPTTIEIKLVNETNEINVDGGNPTGSIDGAVFVLEFTYYNSNETAHDLVNQYTPHLV